MGVGEKKGKGGKEGELVVRGEGAGVRVNYKGGRRWF
jgi:hypothetical protein